MGTNTFLKYLKYKYFLRNKFQTPNTNNFYARLFEIPVKVFESLNKNTLETNTNTSWEISFKHQIQIIFIQGYLKYQ